MMFLPDQKLVRRKPSCARAVPAGGHNFRDFKMPQREWNLFVQCKTDPLPRSIAQCQRIPYQLMMSGCDRLIGRALVEEGDRLEPVIARPAMPEITGAAFAAFNPLGYRDRLAALSTGILFGQKSKTGPGHGVLPLSFGCCCLLLA
jgi:hypothetical protein